MRSVMLTHPMPAPFTPRGGVDGDQMPPNRAHVAPPSNLSELCAAWTSNEAFKQSREALNSRDVLSSAAKNSTFMWRTRAGTRQRRQSGEERRQTTIQQYSGKLNLPKACVCTRSAPFRRRQGCNIRLDRRCDSSHATYTDKPCPQSPTLRVRDRRRRDESMVVCLVLVSLGRTNLKLGRCRRFQRRYQ